MTFSIRQSGTDRPTKPDVLTPRTNHQSPLTVLLVPGARGDVGVLALAIRRPARTDQRLDENSRLRQILRDFSG
jgi:hypothetical protein